MKLATYRVISQSGGRKTHLAYRGALRALCGAMVGPSATVFTRRQPCQRCDKAAA